MSKPDKASPADASTTTVVLPSGATNTSQKSPLDLLKIDVSGFTEQKNGLTYLSWAHAWAEALKVDPSATFHVESWTDDLGKSRCWMDINGTAMVWVRVTMLGQARTCMLPVMNSKNEPISIEGRTFKDKFGKDKTEKLDAFNVNTAIMRCMTKCLALFGLGLNIYAGEDLPMVSDEPEAKPEPKKEEPKKEEKKEEKKEDDSAKKAKAQLFADGMVKYTEICKDYSGLVSYWKANQEQLDKLKNGYPDLYKKVQEVFSQKRTELGGSNG